MKRPSGLTLLAGALLLLMPALAVLQFRWVGQVSDSEKERRQLNVETAARQFRQAFQQELGLARTLLSVSAETSRDAAWHRFASRHEEWESSTTRVELVRNIYLVDADAHGELRVRHWDNDADQFQTTPWPAVLEPWRNDFMAELEDFRWARQSDRQTHFLGQDALMIQAQLPIREPATRAPRGRASGRTDSGQQTVTTTTSFVFGFTVLELNMAYVREQFLPDLAERHFTHPNSDSFRIAVVEADDQGRVIFQSDPEAPINPGTADTSLEFFPRFRGIGGPPREALTTALADRRTQNDPQGAGRPRAGDQGRWRLIVQHQSGSLEAVVAGAKRRNLALSFGVLIMLTITIGLLTVTSRKAQRLAEQQIEFVAGVSHELRTPVAVIRSAAENLSQGVVGSAERVKRYGQMIEGEARRLGEMVERVLQYAGIESGLGYGSRTTLAPSEIIQSAVDSAKPLLGPETVDIHADIPDALPPVVGDAAALRSAVQNLVANAVKYGGADRWVGIRAEHVRDRRRSEVRITVSDHGAGIPASELPHIFEPFYRGGDALARQIHGNGLGLSLVKRIVTAHGGRVTVDTRAGVGSSFTITLPAAEPEPSSTSVPGEIRAAAHS